MTTLFQHRHYVEIAKMVADLPNDVKPVVARAFSEWLHGTNPNYNRQRFYDAAMGEPKGRDRVR